VKDTDKNPFDDSIRERLEQFEMPYDPAAWSRFEQRLTKTTPPVSQGLSGMAKLGIGAAAVALLAAAALLWPEQQMEVPVGQDVNRQEEAVHFEVTETSEPDPTPAQRTSTDEVPQTVSEPSTHTEPEVSKTPNVQGITTASENLKPDKVAARTGLTNDDENARPAKENTRPLADTERFNLKMAVSKTKVCVGDEVSFMAISDAAGIRYEWIFGDGERSSRNEAVKTFLSPGTFEVVLSGSRGELVTERTETITIYPAPTVMFEMERPVVGIPLYELSTSLQNGERSYWEFSDGRNTSDLDTRQLFRSRGSASAKLTVTNEYGCSSSREQTVRIDEDFRLFAETGFTPNGDGINDHFLPKALEVMDMPFEMTVRDAYGKEVFRTSDLNEPWNGREFNTGLTLPRGSYLWTVVLTEPILRNPVFTGNITIQ
jgi:gliding motility-associated-like protein